MTASSRALSEKRRLDLANCGIVYMFVCVCAFFFVLVFVHSFIHQNCIEHLSWALGVGDAMVSKETPFLPL